MNGEEYTKTLSISLLFEIALFTFTTRNYFQTPGASETSKVFIVDTPLNALQSPFLSPTRRKFMIFTFIIVVCIMVFFAISVFHRSIPVLMNYCRNQGCRSIFEITFLDKSAIIVDTAIAIVVAKMILV